MELAKNQYEFWWLMTTGELSRPRLYCGKEGRGYILIRGKTSGGKLVQEQEHRIVMEEWLCRKLRSDEEIHHINADRSDNRLENLLLCHGRKEHLSYHPRERGWHHSPETRAKMSANHKSRWRRPDVATVPQDQP